jgi:hypothetical protein
VAPTLSRSSVHRLMMVWRHFDPDLGERIGILPEASRQRIWGIAQQDRQKRTYGAEVEIDRPKILQRILRTFDVAPIVSLINCFERGCRNTSNPVSRGA